MRAQNNISIKDQSRVMSDLRGSLAKSKQSPIEVKPLTKPYYQSIIKKHDITVTDDRLQDFRMTMREIVDQKNGIIPTDSLERLDFDVVAPS